MATPSALTPAAACTPSAYQIPSAPPGKTITFCIVDTFGNHTDVLKSCCKDSSGTITTSTDGCNVYCTIDNPLLNSTMACFNDKFVPAFCGHSNITEPSISSSSSSTDTATTSATSPSKSNSSEQPKLGKFVLGIVVLLGVSMILGV